MWRRWLSQAVREKRLSRTAKDLLEILINLSKGKLGQCKPRVRWLAEQMGLSQRHTRRLLQELEQNHLIERIPRQDALGACKSNLIIVKMPPPEPQMPGPQEKEPAPEPAAPVDLHGELQDILVGFRLGRYQQGARQLLSFFTSHQQHPLLRRFCQYYAQKHPYIQNIWAYVYKTIAHAARTGFIAFWEACLAFLAQSIPPPPTPPSPAPAPAPVTLERLLTSIPDHLPPDLRQRMADFYRQRFG